MRSQYTKRVKSLLFFLIWGGVFFTSGCNSDTPEPVIPSTPDPDEKLDQNIEKIKSANWNSLTVKNTIIWKYFHFNDLFSSKQFVNVLDIDLSTSNLKIDIPYVRSGFLKTSDAALNTHATAAINGSFFNTSVGGSTVFLKKNGEIIKYTNSGFTPYRENAGFAFNDNGAPEIVIRPTAGWSSLQYSNLLASGPLLLLENESVKQEEQAFNLNRHPRTAIGITDDNRLIAVVVDGRNSESSGMTINELTILMKALGCVDAMNLDGGGSSTMWVRNRGVVNHPSDNGVFDNQGERGVATVISFVVE